MPLNADNAFSYLEVLALLEDACRTAARPARREGAKPYRAFIDAQRTRALKLSANIIELLKSTLKNAGAQPRAKLGRAVVIKADKIRRLENQLLESIELHTSWNRPSTHRDARAWPAPPSTERILSRLIATSLGLHAGSTPDDLDSDLRRCLATCIGSILVPTLAWKILEEVMDQPEGARIELLVGIRRRLREGLTGRETIQASITGDKPIDVEIHSLTLVKGWKECLAKLLEVDKQEHSFGGLQDLLLDPLAQVLDTADCEKKRQELAQMIGREFTLEQEGSDRQRAIELAKKNHRHVAFQHSRLILLDAATSCALSDFSLSARNNLREACRDATVYLESRASDPVELSGRAFWLARACFRRPAGSQFGYGVDGQVEARVRNDSLRFAGREQAEDATDYDVASTLVGELLRQGIEHSHDKEQRLLMARYLAGFATNPRYWHSVVICRNAADHVDRYARADGCLPSLVHLFEARLKWRDAMQHGKVNQARLNEASNAYLRSLDTAGSNLSRLDSEAPIHLFSEIGVLLKQHESKNFQKELGAIDFILSRNFAIYMDIENEERAIVSGLDQARAHLRLSLTPADLEKVEAIEREKHINSPMAIEIPLGKADYGSLKRDAADGMMLDQRSRRREGPERRRSK